MTAEEEFAPVPGETEAEKWKRHSRKWEARCRAHTAELRKLREALNVILDFADER